jgi:hypothetical protein
MDPGVASWRERRVPPLHQREDMPRLRGSVIESSLSEDVARYLEPAVSGSGSRSCGTSLRNTVERSPHGAPAISEEAHSSLGFRWLVASRRAGHPPNSGDPSTHLEVFTATRWEHAADGDAVVRLHRPQDPGLSSSRLA